MINNQIYGNEDNMRLKTVWKIVHLQNILQVSKSEQVKEFVAKSLVGINRLIHMVQQLLILSRLDADQEQEALRMLDLGLMLDEISNELKNQDFMKRKNIVISNRQNVQWRSRETQMRILLRNLLDNACRYAEDNTQISIIITDKELIVRNVCAFMPDGLLQQSLERFKRGSSSQQGSGLGLSICKQVCVQNNYGLSMLNRKDGEQGIEMTISIL